jgi:hypothetical protein
LPEYRTGAAKELKEERRRERKSEQRTLRRLRQTQKQTAQAKAQAEVNQRRSRQFTTFMTKHTQPREEQEAVSTEPTAAAADSASGAVVQTAAVELMDIVPAVGQYDQVPGCCLENGGCNQATHGFQVTIARLQPVVEQLTCIPSLQQKPAVEDPCSAALLRREWQMVSGTIIPQVVDHLSGISPKEVAERRRFWQMENYEQATEKNGEEQRQHGQQQALEDSLMEVVDDEELEEPSIEISSSAAMVLMVKAIDALNPPAIHTLNPTSAHIDEKKIDPKYLPPQLEEAAAKEPKSTAKIREHVCSLLLRLCTNSSSSKDGHKLKASARKKKKRRSKQSRRFEEKTTFDGAIEDSTLICSWHLQRQIKMCVKHLEGKKEDSLQQPPSADSRSKENGVRNRLIRVAKIALFGSAAFELEWWTADRYKSFKDKERTAGAEGAGAHSEATKDHPDAPAGSIDGGFRRPSIKDRTRVYSKCVCA